MASIRNTGAAASGTTPVSVPVPTGTLIQTGDALFILVAAMATTPNADPVTTPAGWTKLAVMNSGLATTDETLTVLGKIAGASESAVSLTVTGADHTIARMVAVYGHALAAITDAVVGADNSATTGATATALGITVEEGALVLICATTGRDFASTTNFTAWANTNLVSTVASPSLPQEQMDNGVTQGNGGGIAMASGTAIAAAIGNSTVTIASSTDPWCAVHIGIKTHADYAPAIASVSWPTSAGGHYCMGTFKALTPGVPIVEVKKAHAMTPTSATTLTATWDGGGTATAGNLLVALVVPCQTSDISPSWTGATNNGSGRCAILTKISDGTETGATITLGVAAQYAIALFELDNAPATAAAAFDQQARSNFGAGTFSSKFGTPGRVQKDEWFGAVVGVGTAQGGAFFTWDSTYGFTDYYEDTRSTAVSKVVPGGPTQVVGAASLTATGTLAAAGKRTAYGVAPLSGAGALNVASTKRTGKFAAVLSATGTLVVPNSKRSAFGVAVLSGAGALVVPNTVRAKVGAAVLSGTGSLVAAVKRTQKGIAALTGTGSLVVPNWKRTAKVVAALSGSGTLVADGVIVGGPGDVFGSAVLQGGGNLAAVAKRTQYGAAVLSMTSTLTVVGVPKRYGAAVLGGTGTISATGTVVGQIFGAANLTAVGSLTGVGKALKTGSATLVGTGVLNVARLKGTHKPEALLTGVGSLTATGKRGQRGIAVLTGQGTLVSKALIIPPYVPPPPSTEYRLELRTLAGAVVRDDILGEDYSPDMSYSYALNGPGAMTFQLPARKSGVTPANYLVGQRTLHLYRNDVLVWGGWLSEADGDRDWVSFSGRGWYDGLRRRLIDTNQHFYSIEALDIAWNLIAYTQGKTSLGITRDPGETPSGKLRTRDFCCDDFTLVSEAIEDLAGMNVGFDFWVTPNKVWTTKSPRRGIDRTATVVFDAAKNCSVMSYSQSTEDMATEVLYVGPNPDECRDLDSLASSTGLTTYGRHELGVDMTNLKNDVERDEYAAELLRYQSVPLTQATVVCPRELGIEPLSFDLGDRTTLQSAEGWMTFNQTMRVIDFSVHVGLDCVEETTVQLDSVYT